MKAEIERFNFAKLVPSATFGKFIVEIPARSERVTNYIMMNGLSDESSELLDKDPRALLELFELSETGFFTLKHDENP